MLRLSLFPSRVFAGLLIVAHGVSLVAVWVVDWPLWVKVLASIAVFASCMFHLHRDALLRLPYSVATVILKQDGSIDVTQRNGVTMTGRQVPGSFVHPWFTTILWRGEGARFLRSVVVLPDSLSADQFRELRVWLKWWRTEKAEGRS